MDFSQAHFLEIVPEKIQSVTRGVSTKSFPDHRSCSVIGPGGGGSAMMLNANQMLHYHSHQYVDRSRQVPNMAVFLVKLCVVGALCLSEYEVSYGLKK